MNQADFFTNLVEYSKSESFSFLTPGQQFDDPQMVSGGKQALVAAVAGAAFGLVGSLSCGYMDATHKAGLIADLKKMNELCDLVGIRLSEGNVILRLGITADAISNEALVGRFALIQERAYDFRKYAISIFRTIWSDGKLATVAQVVLAFSMHRRAKEFTQEFADKCKHKAIWKKVHTQPWIADLEDQELTRLREPLDALLFRDSEKITAALFRARSQTS